MKAILISNIANIFFQILVLVVLLFKQLYLQLLYIIKEIYKK